MDVRCLLSVTAPLLFRWVIRILLIGSRCKSLCCFQLENVGHSMTWCFVSVFIHEYNKDWLLIVYRLNVGFNNYLNICVCSLYKKPEKLFSQNESTLPPGNCCL